MAAPSKKITMGGFNAGYFFGLNNSGYIAATTHTTPYAGYPIGGPVELAVTFPDPTVIVWPGNNGKIQQDIFPSGEASTVALTLSRNDADVYALLSGTLVQVLGDSNVTIAGHNDEGNEPTVALLAYAQSKDESGNRRWTTYIFPKIIFVPKKPGMSSRTAAQHMYNGTPQRTTKSITGTALVSGTNGATAAELWVYESNYRLAVVGWIGNNSETAFEYETSRQAASASVIGVFVDGVLKTGGGTDYTPATDKITFTAAPGTGTNITVIYELADSAVDIS